MNVFGKPSTHKFKVDKFHALKNYAIPYFVTCHPRWKQVIRRNGGSLVPETCQFWISGSQGNPWREIHESRSCRSAYSHKKNSLRSGSKMMVLYLSHPDVDQFPSISVWFDQLLKSATVHVLRGCTWITLWICQHKRSPCSTSRRHRPERSTIEGFLPDDHQEHGWGFLFQESGSQSARLQLSPAFIRGVHSDAVCVSSHTAAILTTMMTGSTLVAAIFSVYLIMRHKKEKLFNKAQMHWMSTELMLCVVFLR